MTRIGELLGEFGVSGESRRDAEVLLGSALDRQRSYLYGWPEAEVPPQTEANFRALMDERRRGVPVAYLLGHREFWSLDLLVSDATLIPRADTEVLVSLALTLALPEQSRVLDLGTGSGAIALALASERPAWSVTAVDASPAAIAVARRNGEHCDLPGVRFLAGDWFAPVSTERFDLVISNPPYVAPGDPCLEEGDLRFEPRSALVAGAGGYADIDAIAAAAPPRLAPNGFLLLEHGADQGPGVRDRLEAAGFADVATHRDLAGHERATLGRKPGGD